MPKTLKEQLEESFEIEEEQETGGSPEDTEEPVGAAKEDGSTEQDTSVDDDTGAEEEPTEDKDAEPVPDPADEPGDEEPPADDTAGQEHSKPPVSWKPAVREHWAKLPSDVKAEVMRREGEIQKGLQQASGYRKVAEEYLNTVRPYQGLMQSMGASPSQAITTVMSSVAQLASGTVNQKAEVIASIINDYGVNIEALDTILSGQELPDDPNAPLLQQLDERLAPMNDFMTQMQGYQQTQDTEVNQNAASTLMEFAADEANEFFEDVRAGMADYLEVAANSQRLMTLQEAYDRACQDSPEIKKVLAQRAAALKATPTGDELANKRRAASSVSGSPNAGGKLSEDASLGDTIRAQFDDAEEAR